MEEYPSNSFKSKELEAKKEREKKDKVVTGIVRKKKGVTSKLASIFLEEDIDNVGSYIVNDVLIPSAKKAVHDVLADSVDMLFGNGTRSKTSVPGSRVSYRSYYNDKQDRRSVPQGPRKMATYEYNDIEFENRGDAENVLSCMEETISMYGIVSVADLYDFAGYPGTPTDQKYGWDDLHTAYVYRKVGISGGGYSIKFPRARPIE